MQGNDPILSEHFRWGWEMYSYQSAGRSDTHQSGLPYLFPRLADYSSGTLCFSEEELVEQIFASLEPTRELLGREAVAINNAVLPDNFWIEGSDISSSSFPSETDMIFLPMPNQQGGATAVVYSYCAVNSNTENPEDAVAVLDFLMSGSAQKTVWGTPRTICAGMPVNQQALTREHTGFTEQSLSEWKKAVKQVNIVHFPSPLDTELNQMVREVQQMMKNNYNPTAYLEEFANGSITKDELSAIVREHYNEMQRLLDEA